MKKKVKVTAKAIVNDGEGQISIFITDNLPKSAINIIGKYATVKYNDYTKLYHLTPANSRIPDDLQYHCFTISRVVDKLLHSLDREGLKDCIIREESITKTYNKPVEKITIGVDTKGRSGTMYVHVHTPEGKEFFELDIINRVMIEGADWHLIPDESLKLSKRLSEDECLIVEDKIQRILDSLPEKNKSFVKTIKC